jgi:hypothetical protein
VGCFSEGARLQGRAGEGLSFIREEPGRTKFYIEKRSKMDKILLEYLLSNLC